jgi:hypothetical protein
MNHLQGSSPVGKNTGKGYRQGEVKERSQTYNPKNDKWVKRDDDTGQFKQVKEDGTPFKGVRKEGDDK